MAYSNSADLETNLSLGWASLYEQVALAWSRRFRMDRTPESSRTREHRPSRGCKRYSVRRNVCEKWTNWLAQPRTSLIDHTSFLTWQSGQFPSYKTITPVACFDAPPSSSAISVVSAALPTERREMTGRNAIRPSCTFMVRMFYSGMVPLCSFNGPITKRSCYHVIFYPRY